jgi:hypothetical protein
MTPQVNVENVVKAYLALRDKRSELKHKYDAIDGELRSKMDKLEGFLAQQMQDTGATTLGTSVGTAYRQLKIRGSGGDWPTAWQWMAENSRFDFLEKRISSTALKAYLEENSEPPPGINVHTEYEVVVRKK